MIELVYLYLSCCREYYIGDEITMLIDECLGLCWLISWQLYVMWLRWCCFMIRVALHEIMRFTFIWDFGELFTRIQGVGMSCYVYWTIGDFMSVMNIWMMNLWYYNLLWYWDWWMNMWWRMILIWMIITYMHLWMTLHVSKHVSCG